MIKTLKINLKIYQGNLIKSQLRLLRSSDQPQKYFLPRHKKNLLNQK